MVSNIAQRKILILFLCFAAPSRNFVPVLPPPASKLFVLPAH
jgi:hypothetical protein